MAQANTINLVSALEVSTMEPEPKEHGSLASVRAKMKYNLQDLINECDPNQPWSEEDSAWFNDSPVGDEVL